MQESQQFKHNFLLLFMKLRWFLKRWRQGKVLPSEEDDFLEVWLSIALARGWKNGSVAPEFCLLPRTVPGWGLCYLDCLLPGSPGLLNVVFSNQMNSMKELYLLMEEEEMNAQHSDNKACTGESWTQNTVCLTPSGPTLTVCNSFINERFLLSSQP